MSDHLRVAWLLLRTLLSAGWFVLWIPLSPVLRPWVRSRVRAAMGRSPPPPVEPPPPSPEDWRGRTVFFVAGEVSGDRLAARVARAMGSLCPGAVLRGYGGPEMAEAGVRLDRDIVGHAVVGFFAVMGSLAFWWRLCVEALARFREDPPDLLFTVDYPGLNVRLARWARRRGIRTVHLVAPHVWAYAPWRALRWRRAADLLLATFPFEPATLARSGIRAVYVGHPSFEAPLPPPRTAEDWPGRGPCTVELLPGSRAREVRDHAADLLEAARRIEDRLPEARFVVRLASPEAVPWFEAAAAEASSRPGRLSVRVGEHAPEAPLLGALAASGTVTAELAAALVPMSVFYRVTWLARVGERTLVTAPWICLANLVAGRSVVPERVYTRRGNAAALARDFLSVAGDERAWAEARSRLAEVRRRLETPAVAVRAASAALRAAR